MVGWIMDFNPRAPCGARPAELPADYHAVPISIHAPLAGRDHGVLPQSKAYPDFNPRAPCGARLFPCYHLIGMSIFQSTRPLRGATRLMAPLDRPLDISIHAPLAGRDDFAHVYRIPGTVFQSTRPLRGATTTLLVRAFLSLISIHAPLAGRDLLLDLLEELLWEISIHAPLAGRDRLTACSIPYKSVFQSTRPLRGATNSDRQLYIDMIFQSTRPLRGATCVCVCVCV